MDKKREMMVRIVDALETSPDKKDQIILSLYSFVLNNFVGDGFIDRFIDTIELQLLDSILNPSSRKIHDISLAILSLISIHCFDDIETQINLIAKELLERINEIKNGQCFRFTALSIFAAFTISDEELCKSILETFLSLALNKHHKSCKFSPTTVCSIYDGIALMLSFFPEHVSAQTHYQQIMESVDTGLNSSIPEIIQSALDVLAVFFENVSNFRPEDSDPFITKAEVRRKYEPLVASIGERTSTKQAKKQAQSKFKELLAFFDGRAAVENVTINQQIVYIDGPGKRIIFATIKNLSGKFFPQQISFNERVQEIVGIKLLSKKAAEEKKKQYRDELDRERELSKREREKKRADKRKQKEKNYNDHSPF